MKLTPAEFFVQSIYGGSTHVELQFNPIIEIPALELVQKIRQLLSDQANQLDRGSKPEPKPDPICPECGGRQGFPNSMTHHGAIHACWCSKEERQKNPHELPHPQS